MKYSSIHPTCAKGTLNVASTECSNIAAAVLTLNPIAIGVTVAFSAADIFNASAERHELEKTRAEWKQESAELSTSLNLDKKQYHSVETLVDEYKKCALEYAQLTKYKQITAAQEQLTDKTPIPMSAVKEATQHLSLPIKDPEIQPTTYGAALRDSLLAFNAKEDSELFTKCASEPKSTHTKEHKDAKDTAKSVQLTHEKPPWLEDILTHTQRAHTISQSR
jgi:hypothetical protein